jgi:hypothetical protein
MTANINPGDVSSQYWLVGTFIPGLGVNEPNAGNDYAKIAALGGTDPARVPEPGSLGLAGLTIIALGVVRRLRKPDKAA